MYAPLASRAAQFAVEMPPTFWWLSRLLVGLARHFYGLRPPPQAATPLERTLFLLHWIAEARAERVHGRRAATLTLADGRIIAITKDEIVAYRDEGALVKRQPLDTIALPGKSYIPFNGPLGLPRVSLMCPASYHGKPVDVVERTDGITLVIDGYRLRAYGSIHAYRHDMAPFSEISIGD
jgi:hypothetical protein